MTAVELIDYLAQLPPDTPVVAWDGVAGLYANLQPKVEKMHRLPSGSYYSQFQATVNQKRNNVTVVVLR